jgi:microcystin degradation protein MlrC
MTLKRIGILEINQESNSFASVTSKLKEFQDCYLLFGEEIIRKLKQTSTEIGGFLDILAAEKDIEIIPLFAAHAMPAGLAEQEVIEYFGSEIIEQLQRVDSLDGLLVVLHGAMLGVEEEDPEGFFLECMRKVVNDDIPIIGTLDLHAHVTPKMIQMATALIGYRHYPHDDTFETGQRAAKLLLDVIHGKVEPVMAMSKVPMIVPPNDMQTFEGPMKKMVDEELELEKDEEIVSVSSFPVQAWLDTPNIGFTTIVITNGKPGRAREESERLARMAWNMREECLVRTFIVDDAIHRGLSSNEQPILLVDTADSLGGGATGDSAFVLERLIASNIDVPCILSIVDPVAVQEAVSAGVGEKIHIKVGNRLDPRRGEPVEVAGVVRKISDGRFQYRGGLFDGTRATMGLSVVLEIGTISLLISSQGSYEWDDVQYRSMGLDVRDAKFVVVKMPMNYKITYREIAKQVYVLDTAGACSPNLTKLPYSKISRPLYPFDSIDAVNVNTILGIRN